MFQIEPFASLVNTVRSTVPRLLLNRHAVGPFEKVPLRRGDHMELGNLEDTVRKFAEMLGWNIEIEELMRNQETLVGCKSSHRSYMSQLKRGKKNCRMIVTPSCGTQWFSFLSADHPSVGKQSAITDMSDQSNSRASREDGDIQVHTRSSESSRQRRRGDRF